MPHDPLDPLWAIIAAYWKPIAAVWAASFVYCTWTEAAIFYEPKFGIREALSHTRWQAYLLIGWAVAPVIIEQTIRKELLIRRLWRKHRVPICESRDLADKLMARVGGIPRTKDLRRLLHDEMIQFEHSRLADEIIERAGGTDV